MNALSFGPWLKRRRRSLDLTQDELADRVACSVETIRKLEADSLRPSKALAERLAETLDIPPPQQAHFVRFARGQADAEPLPMPTLPLDPARPPPPAAAPAPPAPAAPSRPPTRLPIPPTPLIGRQQQTTEICHLLRQPHPRLVTLIGVGGAGKTRLALQVAADLAADFPDGIFFVPLAAIRDPGLVVSTIAQRLGVRESGGQARRERLIEWLGEQRLLLVLDNFEQVLKAAEVVAEVLARCGGLKVLVTSRAPLHLQGEQLYRVPPLALPPRTDGPGTTDQGLEADTPTSHNTPPPGRDAATDVTQYAAVQLFVQRAQQVRPDFTLTETNRQAVVEICRQLDGLPLALELAAARVHLLLPGAMLQRLTQRLALLTGGPRDLPARQQTMRAAIDWSFDLLDEREKIVFRRLSVFTGGFTLEAAEQVCNARGDLGVTVLDGVESLVAESLLGDAGEPDAARLVMLETIREYASGKLQDSGEAEAVRDRHLDYFLKLVELVSEELWRGEAAPWIERVEQERDNLRAALAWSLNEPSRLAAGTSMVMALVQFWQLRGDFDEGLAWLDLALTRSPDAPPLVRADLLAKRGFLTLHRRSFEEARYYIEQAVALYQQAGDTDGVGEQLSFLAHLVLDSGDTSLALRLGEQSLASQRAAGNTWGMSVALFAVGDGAYLLGDLRRARECYEESIALCRSLELGWPVTRRFVRLGQVARRTGNLADAAIQLMAALTLARDVGDNWGVTMALAGLGHLAVAQGQPEQAARLLGATQARLDAFGAHLWPLDRVEYDQAIATLRSTLQLDEFTTLWTEGQAMTPDQAVAYALAGQDPTTPVCHDLRPTIQQAASLR